MTGELPTYRDIWPRIRRAFTQESRGTESAGEEPSCPRSWKAPWKACIPTTKNITTYGSAIPRPFPGASPRRFSSSSATIPTFPAWCTTHIAGWEKTLSDGQKVLVPGKLALFSNVNREAWFPRPNTILIDSEQLESGEAMSDEFKKIASVEIERFKEEYKARFPGRDTDSLTDEDLLREVMNTVGKQGRLGEQIKCVVSVSMLTEGWDASTVTHILGVRAFGTQLLCEQVVGRGLRRMSHAVTRHRPLW